MVRQKQAWVWHRAGRFRAVHSLIIPGLIAGVTILAGCGSILARGAVVPTQAVGLTSTKRPSQSTGVISCPSGDGMYLTCNYRLASGGGMTFYLFVPEDYTPDKQYPLVLLLHGGGEKAIHGNSVDSNRTLLLKQQYVAVWGPGYPKGQSVQTKWPSFVVVPQVESPGTWVDTPVHQGAYSLAAHPTRWLSMAMDIVRLVQKQYTGVDANRLYITGISMGGYGVWDAIERWPDVFAAAAPVAGAGAPSLASRLIHLPIWDFHGAQDKVIPVSGSTSMYHAIASAGGHSCLTVYPSEQHGIWPIVYSVPQPSNSGSGLFAWLFAQRKGQRSTGSPVCSA
jgi:predicted peptidase